MHTKKTLFRVIMFLLFVTLTLSAYGKPRIARKVTPEEASELIRERDTDPDFIILDVRRPKDYAGGHIEGAVNINFSGEDFRKSIEALERKRAYLIYCYSGKTSAKTLGIMRGLGFREVYDMTGGIRAWREKDLPIVK